MSHSCQSNLQHEHSQQNGTMVLIAQRTIEEGEELTIRYIDTVQGNIFIWKKYVDMCIFSSIIATLLTFLMSNRKIIEWTDP